jgi:hypothetical protein
MSFIPGMHPGGMAEKLPRYVFASGTHNLPTNQDPMSETVDWGDEPGPGETRHLLVGIGFVTASAVEPEGLTVGGNAATRLVGSAPAGVFTVGQAFWIIEQPTGTSGVIEYGVPSGDIDGGCIAVWGCYNLKSPALRDSVTHVSAAGRADYSLNTKSKGIVAMLNFFSNTNSLPVFLSGISADSVDTVANGQDSMASSFLVAAETPRAIEAWLENGGDDFHAPGIAVSLR